MNPLGANGMENVNIVNGRERNEAQEVSDLNTLPMAITVEQNPSYPQFREQTSGEGTQNQDTQNPGEEEHYASIPPRPGSETSGHYEDL